VEDVVPHTALIVAAGLSIAGTAIGIGMGRSSLAEINPANFNGADSPFSAALGESRTRAEWAQLQAQEYQAAAQATPPQGCADCTWPMAPVPPQDPAVARLDQPRTAVVPLARAEAPVRVTLVEQPPEPDWRQVERYASYPVEQPVQAPTQPVQAAADAATPAPQGAGDPGTQ
jgi:hypothetical protein